ncbi:conserved virulence factor C family protein [Ferviditalea candida]|uniref:Conserved virulence factor C family protein n=1 Tax=Ferviditalea candida TaxID=3108399 RepID=A0ABU5ZIX5_9BACL|nr:conserved virulence factor C family protein [Paenibacillaceae bacterium T2]
MKIISIEPTPSPHSMKLNMDESLTAGTRFAFDQERKDGCPDYIAKLLAIPDVKSVFQTADFIALDRFPKGDWQNILSRAREVFGEAPRRQENDNGSAPQQKEASFGETHVLIQMFRNIPLQIRIRSELEEKRLALPERFTGAAMKAHSASPNMIMERKLEDQGIRYGSPEEIAEQVLQEIDAAYDDARLEQLVSLALEQGEGEVPISERKESLSDEQMAARLEHPDWRIRYAAMEKMKPAPQRLPLIVKALLDPHFSVRRLAVAYLGDIKEQDVLPLLYQALKDKHPAVRRTAGDVLSDIGDPDAIEPMCEALKDPNKIVRWRAARFLYEVGDKSALAALREAQDDSEFEISMQVKMALERIEGGHEAEGSVWQQMTRRNP